MIQDRLISFRKSHGYSQEKISEILGVSRQAYAKWERGITVPDVVKCRLLADHYGITLDELTGESVPSIPRTLTPSSEKNIWGTVVVKTDGQVLLPKETRERFGLTPGSRLVVLSDEEGIALIEARKFRENLKKLTDLTDVLSQKTLTI